MTISPHEMWMIGFICTLLAALVGLAGAIVGRELYARKMERAVSKFVTVGFCDARHKGVCVQIEDVRTGLTKTLADLKRDQRIIFRMVRALVSLSGLPPQDMERIINDRDATGRDDD